MSDKNSKVNYTFYGKISRKDALSITDEVRKRSFKEDYWGQSDQKDPERVKADKVIGAIGEWVVNDRLTKCGIACRPTYLEEYKGNRKEKLWNNDVVYLSPLYLPIDGKLICVGQHSSVKTQSFYMGKKVGPSWVWQLDNPKYNRHRDRMLDMLDSAILFYGVILNMPDPRNIYTPPPSHVYEYYIYAFFWPHISRRRKTMAFAKYQDKEAIYLRDVSPWIIGDDVLKQFQQEQEILNV